MHDDFTALRVLARHANFIPVERHEATADRTAPRVVRCNLDALAEGQVMRIVVDAGARSGP
jgi:hypothetical protein